MTGQRQGDSAAGLPSTRRARGRRFARVLFVLAFAGALLLGGCTALLPIARHASPTPIDTTVSIPPNGPLSVSAYPNAAALAPAFVDQLSNWFNAGGTPANEIPWKADISGTVQNELITKTNESYLDALVVSDYKSASNSGDLVDFIGKQEKAHEAALSLYLLTTEFPIKPVESNQPYVRTETALSGSVVSSVENDQVITATVTIVGSDNADPTKNYALTYTKGVTIDTSPEPIQFTWKNVSGNWKLAAVKYLVVAGQ